MAPPEGLNIFPKEEIYFRGPYVSSVVENLYLLNYTSHPIAYKVKTTAPLRFTVKPVMGIVGPDGSDLTIRLVLHPLIGPDGQELESSNSGPPFDRNRQKFLVEWAFIPEDADTSNPTAIVRVPFS